MTRRMAVLGAALAALLAAPGAQAGTPARVRVALGADGIDGQGWGASLDVKAMLRDAAGRVKGGCWVRTSPDGSFNCTWGPVGAAGHGILPPAVNEPGDSVSIEREGTTHASGPLANVRLETLDPETDEVKGVVAPRREKVRITAARNPRLTPAGYREAPPFVKVVRADAGGAFAADLTGEGNPIRNDAVFVGAVQGKFEVGLYASFPGLDLQMGSSYGFLTGIPGTRHSVRLLGPGGALKAEAEVRLGMGGILPAGAARQRVNKAANGRGAGGVLRFEDRGGRQVRVTEGDVVAVGGPGAFSFTVPKLAPALGGTRFAVRTLPHKPIFVSGSVVAGAASATEYEGPGETDAAGLYQLDVSPATITPFSSCRFTVFVEGNYVSASRTLAP